MGAVCPEILKDSGDCEGESWGTCLVVFKAEADCADKVVKGIQGSSVLVGALVDPAAEAEALFCS